MTTPASMTIDLLGLASLIDLLRADGWTVLGPRLVDDVVAHAPISSLDDLPRGSTDDQQPAHYRLARRDDDAVFGYAVGPQSWKPWLYPSRELLRRSTDAVEAAQAGGHGGAAEPQPVIEAPRLALVGVRSCDLHAIELHDAVLLGRSAVDVHYAARREQILVVAVTCSDPAGTCFCSSMGTGPDPDSGFDLALTEIDDASGHRFLVRVGTARGAELLERCPTYEASDADAAAAAAVVDQAVARMGRQLDTTDLRDLLYANADHSRWEEVAQRCFACGNCTLVCPTCFCTTVTDSTSLVDGTRERWRVWDSCFTGEFTHLEPGNVRESTKSRYRQWATHKLAAWWDQFGSSGCVGCGRCITWCPAGIDITAEVAAIRAAPGAEGPEPEE